MNGRITIGFTTVTAALLYNVRWMYAPAVKSIVSETMRNVEVRMAKYNEPTHDSKPARHLKQHKAREFNWRVIFTARRFFNLEGLFIQQKSYCIAQ